MTAKSSSAPTLEAGTTEHLGFLLGTRSQCDPTATCTVTAPGTISDPRFSEGETVSFKKRLVVGAFAVGTLGSVPCS
jgi:hypothetical protein